MVGDALTMYHFTFLPETQDGYSMSSNMGLSFDSGGKQDLTYKRGELHVLFVCIESKEKILYHL